MTAPTDRRPPASDDDTPWPTPRTDGATPETAFRVPFSIGLGLALVAWSVFSQVFVGAAAVALGLDVDDPAALRIVIVGSQLTTLLGALWILHVTGRLSWRLAGPVAPSSVDVPAGIWRGLAGYGMVVLWITAYAAVFGEPEAVEQSLLQDAGSSTAVVVTSVLAAVLLAPLVEEVVFRGVLFQAARRRLGVAAGAVLSSAVWTAVHVELYARPVALGAIFLLGLWFGWVFHRSGRLMVAVLAHATFNAINLGFALAGG